MLLKVIAASVAVVAILLYKAFNLWMALGYHATLWSHYPGPCRMVNMQLGSEDITTLPNGLAFISSGLMEGGLIETKRPEPVGRIFLYDFNNPEKDPVPLKIVHDKKFDQSAFHPHGFSVWSPDTTHKKLGSVVLFVINHGGFAGDHVERFEFSLKDMTLTHTGYTTQQQLGISGSLNDVAAIGTNSFYVTNELSFGSWLGNVLELALLLPYAQVTYFDGKQARPVATGIVTANGINVSPDGKWVYVSESFLGNLIIYERNNKDNSLKLLDKLALGTGIDNIEIDPETGALWIAAQPNVFNYFFHHAPNLPEDGHKSHSQVLRVLFKASPPSAAVASVREVYSDCGVTITAASVASHYHGKLLIGSVLDKTVFCEVNPHVYG